MSTLGTCNATFLVAHEPSHEFHIVEPRTNISADGILGLDFLQDKSRLDLIQNIMEIDYRDGTLKLPFAGIDSLHNPIGIIKETKWTHQPEENGTFHYDNEDGEAPSIKGVTSVSMQRERMKDRKDEEGTPLNRELMGMKNLGQTCFANSILQILLNSTKSISYEDIKGKKGGSAWNQMASMYDLALQGNRIMDPTNVIKKLPNSLAYLFNGAQQDAHEFYLALTNALDSQVENGVNPINAFRGELRKTLTCTNCKQSRSTGEVFRNISLEATHGDIAKAIEKFFAPERLDDYECEHCKRRTVILKYGISKTPRTLSIHLKRFNSQGKKLENQVKVNYNLNILNHEEGENGIKYKIVSAVCHGGATVRNGHYRTLIWNHDKVICLDDERQTIMDDQAARTLVDREGYLIFYEQIEITPVRNREDNGNEIARSTSRSSLSLPLCKMKRKLNWARTARKPNVKEYFRRILRKGSGKILIPATSNITLRIRIPVDKNREVICFSEEILPGVYSSDTISRSTNSEVTVNIVNTGNQEVTLDNYEPSFAYADEYEIVSRPEKNINYMKKSGSVEEDGHEGIENRILNILGLIDMDKDLPPEDKQSIEMICRNFQDIFLLEGDKLTFSEILKHEIPTLREHGPINKKQYRLPESQRAEIARQINKLLENDIIEHSHSPWNAPIILVKKRSANGASEVQYRLVIDYRELNNITQPTVSPLPRIDEILDQLGGARFFTTFDLASGYHQILLDSDDKCKTGFSVPGAHYHFKRMPFGLRGAPATFQRAMNFVLTDLLGKGCFIYLDDAVIFGNTLEEHNNRLTNVFERLRQNNLKLQPAKCQFLKKEISYLGHVCSRDGVKPDPTRTDVVKNFPAPKTVKQVQSFLGFTNYYRRFIDSYSELAAPINNLIRKGQKFKWTEECDKSFNELKRALITAPVLAYPDFSKPFIITTDASKIALGAVLSQGDPGEDKPIAYASKILKETEKNRPAIILELMAITWAVKTFRVFIYGKHFVVYSDHKPLSSALKIKDPTSQFAKYQLKLAEYDFDIRYKPGKKNQNADALSRIPYEEQEEQIVSVVTRAQKRNQQQTNQKEEEVRNKEKTSNNDDAGKTINATSDSPLNLIKEGSTETDTQKGREFLEEVTESGSEPEDNVETLVNKEDIQTLMQDAHYNVLGGHLGTTKTYLRLRRRYKWKGMFKDIKAYIRKCPKCQVNKKSRHCKMPMKITDIAEQPFTKVYLDIVGPCPITQNGNKYILTFQDNLTRFFDCYAIPTCDADCVARIYFEQIICRYRIPKILVTDQGSNFTSETFRQVCKFLGIKKLETTAYHPQSNGILERSHSPLADYLRNFTQDYQDSWDNWLRPAVFVYNNTPHSATKLTPMDCLFGFTADIPTNIKKKPSPVYNHEKYFYLLKHQLQKTHEIAKENLSRAKLLSKQNYDKKLNVKSFKIGDLVLLKNETRVNKLAPYFHGPYEVTKINSDVNTTIKIGSKEKLVHNNRLKYFNT